MPYRDIARTGGAPAPPTPPPYRPLGVSQRQGGVTVKVFSTAEPFTAADYAAYAGMSVELAQTCIDQAVADGLLAVV